jgi:dimethylamine/trimethylamine dehydrogenase
VPDDQLWTALQGRPNLARVGDCLTPSSIADAVYSAHRFGRLLGEPDLPPRRERATLKG